MRKKMLLLLVVVTLWMALILPAAGLAALNASSPAVKVTCQAEDGARFTFEIAAPLAERLDASPSCSYRDS